MMRDLNYFFNPVIVPAGLRKKDETMILVLQRLQ